METSKNEIKFIEIFGKLFPDVDIKAFRYGNESKVNYSHYFIPPENRHLINSKYFYNKELIFFHFTTLEAIQSIILNRFIRLYNLNNLNDPREFNYAGNLIPIDSDRILDAKENMYIISLCRKSLLNKSIQDKFNIWRLYGNNGLGCLIELEFINNRPEDWQDFFLSEIQYGFTEKSNIVRLKSYLEQINTPNKEIGIDLGQLLAFHKSNLYRIENEVRLLYDGRIKKGIGPRKVFDPMNKLLYPLIRKDILKNPSLNVKYLNLPIWIENEDFEIDSIPQIKINSIRIGYQHRDSFEDIKNELLDSFIEKLGYKPEIKMSRLKSSYWGKAL